jgi:Family of unknown function (DUF6460)
LCRERPFDYDQNGRISRRRKGGSVVPMLHSLLRTTVKVAVASLIVGTILAHFGITLDRLTEAFGLSAERIEATIQQSIAWVLPNIALGAIIIVPVWVLAYILRPPGPTA